LGTSDRYIPTDPYEKAIISKIKDKVTKGMMVNGEPSFLKAAPSPFKAIVQTPERKAWEADPDVIRRARTSILHEDESEVIVPHGERMKKMGIFKET